LPFGFPFPLEATEEEDLSFEDDDAGCLVGFINKGNDNAMKLIM